MRYIFKVLTLGDSNLSLPMIKNGKLSHQFQDHEISRWNREINVGTDQAGVEIDVVLSSTIDFDTIIPTSDGILYFLDPNDAQQFELFDMIIEIIQKLGRTIPIIVVFYTRKGLINIPTNFLLEYIWENYLIEAFVFDLYSKNTFYEVLECLSEAMITGSIPINVETAWMRIPYFMDKINRLLVDEKFEDAGNLAEILTNMKKKFEKQDYYINAEQAAWLYFKSGEYLKASVVVQGDINPRDSEKFIRIYVENMIHQGSRLYNMKRFHTAAEKFEKAYLYASIEIKDDELADKARKLAITTWIISTEFQNAFQLLEKLNFEEQKQLLGALTSNIAKAVDWLIEEKKYDMVKAQLYLIIDKFQRMGLFEEIKILGEKLVNVLQILINQSIEENDPHSANLYLEELFNIWETFSLERQEIDSVIRKIAILFLNQYQFSLVDKLITFIQSYTVQKELTELRQQGEEEYRTRQRDKAVTEFSNAISVLKSYVDKEIGIFTQANAEFYRLIEQTKKAGKILEVTSEIKKRAIWFKTVGHIDIFNELLIHLLGVYLDSDMFLPFLQEMVNLRSEERENYLKRSTGKIRNKIEVLIESDESSDKIEQILDSFTRLFRNHLLYDETKEIEHLHVKFKTSRAKKLLESSTGLEESANVLEFLKQADMVYQRLSEKEPLNYDDVLEELTNRYIHHIEEKLNEKRLMKTQNRAQEVEYTLLKEIEQQISETNKINEKIKNSRIQAKFHKRIAEIEAEISKEREAEKIEEEQIHIMVEKLSRLKHMAKEELLRQQDTTIQRQGLKRIHYQTLLSYLASEEYEEALNSYEERVRSLFSQRKMDLAEIDLAVITIILFKIREKQRIIPLRRKFSKSNGFVSQIIDFIITLIDYPDQSIHLHAIRLFDNLALFQEEKALLHQLVRGARSFDEESTIELPEEQINSVQVNEALIKKNVEKLSERKCDLANRESLTQKYWKEAIENIKTQNYPDAALIYFNKIDLLVKNNHEEFFPINLIMGVLCLMKAGRSVEAKRNLEKLTMEINLPQDYIQSLPEKSLCELLLQANQMQDIQHLDLILESFLQHLPLLSVESSFILSLISPSKRNEILNEKEKEKKEKTQSTVVQNQQLANLVRRASEAKERYEESHRKRNALKRMVYRKILDTVANKDYDQASKLYFETAMKQTKKLDYDTASLLVSLGALCLFKNAAPISSIKSYLDDFMIKIGFSEKVISETFTVKLVLLLLEAKNLSNVNIFNNTWDLLQIIPVFDEEKGLIEK